MWPLRHAFGVVSRYVNSLVDSSGKSLTPTVVTTWLNDVSTICCSCVGRTSHVSRLMVSHQDAPCTHTRKFEDSLSRLATRMGIPVGHLRKRLPLLYGEDAPTVTTAVSGKETEWEGERPIKIFQAGQTVLAVVVSGLGTTKVVAPVRCTRKSTSCSFGDKASCFSCLHALRRRGIKRSTLIAATGTIGADAAMDATGSKESIALFNCPRSIQVEASVCEAIRHGKAFRVSLPTSCPGCMDVIGEAPVKVDTGEIMCSLGYCALEVESFICQGKCKRRVYPDGGDAGVILWICSTAATAAIMRGFAREMATSGSPFTSIQRQWNNKYVHLRDSGAYQAMDCLNSAADGKAKATLDQRGEEGPGDGARSAEGGTDGIKRRMKTRSRQTVASMLFLAVRVMCKEPPLCAFRCPTCKDKARRFRFLTADGSWLGYLKRLSSGEYEHPSQACVSVKETVDAASVHPSEWVRRFLRMSLKQPSTRIVVKGGQFNIAKRALAFLCPQALPSELESLSATKGQGLKHRRSLLQSVWSLPNASLMVCDGSITCIKKHLAPRNTLAVTEIAKHNQTLQELETWKAHVKGRHLHAGAAPGGHGGGGGRGGAVEDGGDSNGPVYGAGQVYQGGAVAPAVPSAVNEAAGVAAAVL